ncbi:hypothetical protein BVRB_026400 [Beta vulgaris subsp. vulgaris]|uniref:Uncharacterized protein n=1 Tax=Beta vulgaris subsp. vulgaris TaxID=3555 RepID=A0A0J8DT45_BETVV|nr:hypothetical protein BVRB_026400 [Beta vulgaris subsp. vulgaris]
MAPWIICSEYINLNADFISKTDSQYDSESSVSSRMTNENGLENRVSLITRCGGHLIQLHNLPSQGRIGRNRHQ